MEERAEFGFGVSACIALLTPLSVKRKEKERQKQQTEENYKKRGAYSLSLSLSRRWAVVFSASYTEGEKGGALYWCSVMKVSLLTLLEGELWKLVAMALSIMMSL
jgi:hypothetical protein